jgi:DNA-binding CsgD family transcriptional regulator
MNDVDTTLDAQTGAIYLEFVQACTAGSSDTEAFRSILRRYVKQLLPHSFSIAVLGSLSFDQLTASHMVGVDYPEHFLASISPHMNIRDRPVVAKWLATREPIVIDPVRDRHALSALEIREIEAFGLGRLAIHGQIDLSSRMGSYFSFAGASAEMTDDRLKFMLRLITPHLHAALMSLPAMTVTNPVFERLTAIERVLLLWLAAGRSNAEIAKLRGKSAATVRNQLNALYRKLGASNRAEAVAIASQERVRPPDLPG